MATMLQRRRWLQESLVMVMESADPEGDFLESMAEIVTARTTSERRSGASRSFSHVTSSLTPLSTTAPSSPTSAGPGSTARPTYAATELWLLVLHPAHPADALHKSVLIEVVEN